MAYSARMQSCHQYSVYFAPRGSERIYDLGMHFAQLYLSPFDKLVGIIGEAGSGKSMIVKGMFPGLELSNDDGGVNVRPLPLLTQDDESGFYTPHTYHVDIRFEMAFTQPHVLADAIHQAISRGKRVIVEHFDMIYPYLGRNAHLIIGVGEQIIVTRPNLFGPLPEDIHRIAEQSIVYRRMTHTAEDLCELHMPEKERTRFKHDDVRHGFVFAFQDEKPEIDLDEMERLVREDIEKDLPITYVDEQHVMLGDIVHPCTGPRTHVASTGCVKNFRLMKELFYDAFSNRYLLVGLVGQEELRDAGDLNHLHPNLI